MAEITPIPQVVYTEEDRTNVTDIFGTGDSFTRNAAEEIIDYTIGEDLKRLVPAQADATEPLRFTFKDFREGTHSFHLIPGYEDTKGRPFTSLELVETFSNLRSGENIPGTEKGLAFARTLIPASAGVAGTIYGAKGGAKVGSLLTPGNPAGAIVGGIGGAIVGGLGAQTLIEDLVETEALFGPETNYIPGTDNIYRAMKTAGLMAPYALIPWAINPNTNFGAAKAIEAHFKRLGKDRLGPTVYAAGRIRDSKTGELKSIKPSRALRLGALLESSLASTGKQARGIAPSTGRRLEQQKIRKEIAEGSRLPGPRKENIPSRQRGQIYRTGAYELGAVGGATGFVGGFKPETDLGQLGLELIGTFAGTGAVGVVARPLSLFSEARKRLAEAYREAGQEEVGVIPKLGKVFEGGFRKSVDRFSRQRRSRARAIIEGFLEKEGGYTQEDIQALIQQLEAPDVSEQVGGVRLNLTAAQKTGDPMLQAIEASLTASLGGMSQRQIKEKNKAETAILGLVGALVNDGNPEAAKAAGEILYGIFETGMSNRLARGWSKWFDSWKKFTGGDKDMDQALLGRKLIEIAENNLTLAREQETKLWSAIDDLPIDKFYTVRKEVNPDTGDVEDVVEEKSLPSVITYYENRVKGSPFESFAQENVGELGSVAKAIEELKDQLGLGTPVPVKDLPEVKRLADLRLKLSGEDSLKSADDILSGRKELSRPGPAVDPGPRGIERTSQTGPAEERFKKIKEGVLSSGNSSIKSAARAFDDAEKAMGIEKDIEAGNLKAAIDKLDDFFLERKRDKIEQFTDVPVFGTFAEDPFMDLVKARTALLRTFKEQGPARPSFTKLTLQRDDNGELEVTQENVDTLGQIISQREKNRPRGSATTSHKQSQDVLRAEKQLLSATLEQQAAGPGQAVVGDDPVTLQQLISLRSRALAYARRHGAVQGNSAFAKLASDIAESARLDIENYMKLNPNLDDRAKASMEAYLAANSYSKALNDTFTRGLVDDALSRRRSGALAQAPETLINKLNTVGNISSQRYAQLMEVDEFMRREGLVPVIEGDDGSFASDLNVAQGMEATIDRVLRAFVAETRQIVDEGGKSEQFLDPTKLQAFLEKYRQPLEYLPVLKRDLEDIGTASQLFQNTIDGVRAGTKAWQNQYLYSRLRGIDAKHESLSGVIGEALGSGTPIRKLEFLMKPLSNRNIDGELRERAKDGFLSAVLENVIGVEAGASGAKFNAKTAYQKLFLPLKRGREIAGRGTIPRGPEAAAQRRADIRASRSSLMDVLVRGGVIKDTEFNRLKRLMTELARYQGLEETGNLENALTEGVGPMMDFYLRIAGSAVGTAAQRAMPLGASGPGALVAASAGSKLLRRVFDEMPQISALQVMQEMMDDPVLLAQMLKEPKTERAATNVAQGIKTALIKAGLVTPGRRLIAPLEVEDEEEVVFDTDDDLQGGAGDDQLAPVPTPAPQPRAALPQLPDTPQFQLPSQQAGFLPRLTQAAPASRPTGQPNPQQRQGLAALFPDDPILGVGRAV
jgi:hypothetical protein